MADENELILFRYRIIILFVGYWTYVAKQYKGNGDTIESKTPWCLCVYEEKYMENYITLTEAAENWGISTRRLRTLCEQGRIVGVVKFGKNWAIPVDASKPIDKRVKSGKYVKKSMNISE